MPRKLEYTVSPEYDGRRAVAFLRGFCGFSARLVKKIKYTESGMLRNGEYLRTIDILYAGDRVSVLIPDDAEAPEPMTAPLDIIYEDDDIIVINKSPFMAMHPTHNHQGDTLANAVTAHLNAKGKTAAFRAVGRLDKGTSGAVVCALNHLAASKLSGKVNKQYCALVEGELCESGTVDVPIYRPDPMKTLRACSNELGVETAVTHWTAEKHLDGATLVRLDLETGRTHQIRVHMAYIGHPLAGDTMYGDFMPQIGHQLLHCRACRFTHPVTGEELTFEASMPSDFKKTLDMFGCFE